MQVCSGAGGLSGRRQKCGGAEQPQAKAPDSFLLFVGVLVAQRRMFGSNLPVCKFAALSARDVVDSSRASQQVGRQDEWTECRQKLRFTDWTTIARADREKPQVASGSGLICLSDAQKDLHLRGPVEIAFQWSSAADGHMSTVKGSSMRGLRVCGLAIGEGRLAETPKSLREGVWGFLELALSATGIGCHRHPARTDMRPMATSDLQLDRSMAGDHLRNLCFAVGKTSSPHLVS